MASCGSLLKSAVVGLALLMIVVESGPVGEKLASCCKKVNSQRITDPITGYMVQKASLSCVPAVIFQTEKGLFCSQVTAPWVRKKISAFEKAKARAALSEVPSSTSSLLSIITSSASPPSPSTSFPSASEMPAHEILSEDNE